MLVLFGSQRINIKTTRSLRVSIAQLILHHQIKRNTCLSRAFPHCIQGGHQSSKNFTLTSTWVVDLVFRDAAEGDLLLVFPSSLVPAVQGNYLIMYAPLLYLFHNLITII